MTLQPAQGDRDLGSARRAARERQDFSLLRERVPYAVFLDVQVTLSEGLPIFRLPFRKSLIGNQVLPALHGGAVAGFMENAALLHLLLLLDETRVPKSIDFSIDYLRSATAVDSYASCEVARQGRRVAQVQIRCWQGEGDTVLRSRPQGENEWVREPERNPARDEAIRHESGLTLAHTQNESAAGLKGHPGMTRQVALARAHFLLGSAGASPE